jgi:hypothetical protein
MSSASPQHRMTRELFRFIQCENKNILPFS